MEYSIREKINSITLQLHQFDDPHRKIHFIHSLRNMLLKEYSDFTFFKKVTKYFHFHRMKHALDYLEEEITNSLPGISESTKIPLLPDTTFRKKWWYKNYICV